MDMGKSWTVLSGNSQVAYICSRDVERVAAAVLCAADVQVRPHYITTGTQEGCTDLWHTCVTVRGSCGSPADTADALHRPVTPHWRHTAYVPSTVSPSDEVRQLNSRLRRTWQSYSVLHAFVRTWRERWPASRCHDDNAVEPPRSRSNSPSHLQQLQLSYIFVQSTE